MAFFCMVVMEFYGVFVLSSVGVTIDDKSGHVLVLTDLSVPQSLTVMRKVRGFASP